MPFRRRAFLSTVNDTPMTEEKQIAFSYTVYPNSGELPPALGQLLEKARNTTAHAYAPYSNFFVGAAAILENGAIVTGTNQENASYPVGICAERILLGNAATLHPDVAIQAIAISYKSNKDDDKVPISPCGMCRQALLEYEGRTGTPIQLLLSGQQGEVWLIHEANQLLPFAFTGEAMP